MSNLDKYDSTSERVEHGTVEERYTKFTKISNLLEKENITIDDIGNNCVNLVDETCGYKLSHGVTSWEIFRVVDVVDMIVGMRDDFLKRKPK